MPPSWRRRRRHTSTKNWCLITLIWLGAGVLTALWMLVAPRQDLGDAALLLFLIFSIIAMIMYIADDVLTIMMVFGPFFLAAAVWIFIAPPQRHPEGGDGGGDSGGGGNDGGGGDDQSVLPIFLALAPLVLVYAVFSFGLVGALLYGLGVLLREVLTIMAAILLGIPVTYGPIVIYHLTLKRYVLRTPRFRRGDTSKDCRTCEICQRVLAQSPLLTGTRALLAATQESHEFYPSIDEMQRAWKGCHLCQALLKPISGDSDSDWDVGAGYGAVTRTRRDSLSFLENGRLMVKIKLERPPWSELGVAFSIGLEIDGAAKFEAVLIEESSLADRVEIAESTGSESSLIRVNGWISDCTETHRLCGPRQQHSSYFIPTRLLYVGTSMRPHLRLVTKADVEKQMRRRRGSGNDDTHSLERKRSPYAALSHCWGGSIEQMLTTANERTFQQGIEEETLPANFRDAISVARRIGTLFLWIDSLCILQGPDGDWVTESPKMGLVFSGALCVIAATASASSPGGCFRERPAWESNQRDLMVSSDSRRRYYLSSGPAPATVETLFGTRVETSPLAGRAWAFQERLLASRVVHFCTDVVLFECETLRASEYHPSGVPYEKESYGIADGRIIHFMRETRKKLDPLLVSRSNSASISFSQPSAPPLPPPPPPSGEQQPLLQQGSHRPTTRGMRGALDVLLSLRPAGSQNVREGLTSTARWYELVGPYSAAALTRSTDRLVALAGVATLVHERSQSSYLAGLWCLPHMQPSLLWAVVRHPARSPAAESQTRPRAQGWGYCAPSWSWASVDGAQVTFLPGKELQGMSQGSRVFFDANVGRAELFYRGVAVTGSAGSLVDSGSLELVGVAARVHFSRDAPRHLRLVGSEWPSLGSLRVRGRKTLYFFPDRDTAGASTPMPTTDLSSPESPAQPRSGPEPHATAALGTVPPAAEEQLPLWEAELYAVPVMTLRTRAKLPGKSYGLVLRRRRRIPSAANSAVHYAEYERVGAFVGVGLTSEDGRRAAEWSRQRLTIV